MTFSSSVSGDRSSSGIIAIQPRRCHQLQKPVERTVFVDVVTACDPTHFQPSDLPLLCRYCEAAVLGEQAALELRRGAVVDGKPSPWITIQEKAVRAMVSLSMRLRLSPQSRIDPKTLGRKEAYAGPKPWELRAD